MTIIINIRFSFLFKKRFFQIKIVITFLQKQPAIFKDMRFSCFPLASYHYLYWITLTYAFMFYTYFKQKSMIFFKSLNNVSFLSFAVLSLFFLICTFFTFFEGINKYNFVRAHTHNFCLSLQKGSFLFSKGKWSFSCLPLSH